MFICEFQAKVDVESQGGAAILTYNLDCNLVVCGDLTQARSASAASSLARNSARDAQGSLLVVLDTTYQVRGCRTCFLEYVYDGW